MYLAAKSGSLDIVKALLEHGAKDDTALFLAFWKGLHLVRLILQYDTQQLLPDSEATIQSRAQLAKVVFHVKGYQYHEVSDQGNHLILLAVKENDSSLLRVLLNLATLTADDLNEKIHGPYSWNLPDHPRSYRTLLSDVRNRGYTEIADLLSTHGGNR